MKYKHSILTILISLFAVIAKAQPIQLQWAHGLYSSPTSFTTLGVNFIEADKNGNSYVVGFYQGTLDLDPSAAEAIITSKVTGFGRSESFIAKYNAAGEFVFGFTLNANIMGIKMLENDDIYLIGEFDTIVDFDPSVSIKTLDGNNNGVFAARYNKSGQYISSFSVGISGVGNFVNSIGMDSKNNLILYGIFSDTIDFDPSANVKNLNTNKVSAFVAKYSEQNELLFAFKIVTFNSGSNYKMILDNLDQIYISGDFLPKSSGIKLDLDPGPGNTNLSAKAGVDGFWAKYDAAGAYIDGYLYDGSIRYMRLDKSNNLCISGSTVDGMDVDLGVAEHKLYSGAGGFDQFLVKYSSNLELKYGVTFRGNSNEMRIEDMQVDDNENVYLCGEFEDTIGFIKGSAQGNVIAKGSRDAFIVKFDKDGNFKFAHSFGNENFEETKAINLDNTGNIWIAGRFTDSINLDPTSVSMSIVKEGTGGAMFFGKYLDPSTVSVKQIKESNIAVYAAKENLVIDLSKENTKNAEIKVFGVSGQSYFSVKNYKNDLVKIPLSKLPQKQVLIVLVNSQEGSLSKKVYIP